MPPAHARRKVIFLTPAELAHAPEFVGRAVEDGYETIIIPETIRRKLPGLTDSAGNQIRDLSQYREEWHQSFEFSFIEPAVFTPAERAVRDTLPQIFASRGGRPARIKDVRVSETMRLMQGRYQEAVGLWQEHDGVIIIKRTQLQSCEEFAGTVLHELSHALSGASDVSLEFEEALTRELGRVAARNVAQDRLVALRGGGSNTQLDAERPRLRTPACRASCATWRTARRAAARPQRARRRPGQNGVRWASTDERAQ